MLSRRWYTFICKYDSVMIYVQSTHSFLTTPAISVEAIWTSAPCQQASPSGKLPAPACATSLLARPWAFCRWPPTLWVLAVCLLLLWASCTFGRVLSVAWWRSASACMPMKYMTVVRRTAGGWLARKRVADLASWAWILSAGPLLDFAKTACWNWSRAPSCRRRIDFRRQDLACCTASTHECCGCGPSWFRNLASFEQSSVLVVIHRMIQRWKRKPLKNRLLYLKFF